MTLQAQAAPRAALAGMLDQAPGECLRAALDLLLASRQTLEAIAAQEGASPAASASTIKPLLSDLDRTITGWPELLHVLAGLSRELTLVLEDRQEADRAKTSRRVEELGKLHANDRFMIDIFFELINAGHEFHTAEEILEESAEILLRQFQVDLYVCRLRREDGSWENIRVGSETKNETPIFVQFMEETHPRHPVMRAVSLDDDTSYVLSHNLRGLERGGESYDCIAYQEGYRSRLAFILRDERMKAFGVIMLYSQIGTYFDRFCKHFFEDCSRIVSMTVGRWLDVGRDAVAKAAGGMAHVGNNILGIMKNRVEMIMEDLEDFTLCAERTLPGEALPDATVPREVVDKLLARLDPERRLAELRQVNESIDRFRRAIDALLSSVEKPVLMHYLGGAQVLDLEPVKRD